MAKAAHPKPQLVALLLCNQAFQQAGTGNWCIIGIFDTLTAPTMPFRVQQFAVYVALSDFAGDAVVELVLRDEEGAVLRAVRGKIPEIQLGLFQYMFPFSDVEFATPGVHTLELLAENELIALRSVRVVFNAPDPEKEDAEAVALSEQHRDRLIRDALEVWAEQPDARPIGLIASAGAAEAPWFRQAFASAFGTTPPQATFVAMIDSNTFLRLLGDQAPDIEEKLTPPPAQEGRVLVVAIVTRNGFKFVYHSVDVE